MICPWCHKPLVEVDNPMRREVRHRRGEETLCPGPPKATNDKESMMESTTAEETVELWTAFGQPGAYEPRRNFAGRVPADHVLSEPTRETFGDGSTLLHAWGHGEADAVARWHEAVAAPAEG